MQVVEERSRLAVVTVPLARTPCSDRAARHIYDTRGERRSVLLRMRKDGVRDVLSSRGAGAVVGRRLSISVPASLSSSTFCFPEKWV